MGQARFDELVRLYGKERAEMVMAQRERVLEKHRLGMMSDQKLQDAKSLVLNIEKENKKRNKAQAEKQQRKDKNRNKRIKKAKKAKIQRDIESFAADLEKNLPKSEVWFRSLYEKHLKIDSDIYNKPFKNRYIPDLINEEFKYIIEIDGTIHETPEVKAKDTTKNVYFKNCGYSVFRIKAYSLTHYIGVLKVICRIRNIDTPQSFKEFILQYEQTYVNK